MPSSNRSLGVLFSLLPIVAALGAGADCSSSSSGGNGAHVQVAGTGATTGTCTKQ